MRKSSKKWRRAYTRYIPKAAQIDGGKFTVTYWQGDYEWNWRSKSAYNVHQDRYEVLHCRWQDLMIEKGRWQE